MSYLYRMVVLFGCLSWQLYAQDAASISASIEPTNPVLGQAFALIVTLEGGSDSNAIPELPSMPELTLLSSSSSSNLTIINGKSQSQRQFTYMLNAQRAGSYTIPPISFMDHGQLLQTEPLRFQVSQATNEATGKADYFVTAALSSNKVYVGQQVIYTLKLYYRINVSDVRLKDENWQGFYVEAMGDGDTHVENSGGIPFRVVTLRRALYPTRVGSLSTPPIQLDFYTMRRQGRGGGQDLFEQFFRDPFFSTGVRTLVSVSAKSIALEVLPLPETDKPSPFSGLVGKISAELQPPPILTVARGSSVTLTTRLHGNAHMQGDLDLAWGESTHFKRYEDKPETKISIQHQGDKTWLEKERIFKTAVVPLTVGPLTLGPLRFVYFDPELKRYATATTQSVTLEVTPGQVNETLQISGNNTPNSGVQPTATDLVPNHSLRWLRDNQSLNPVAPLYFWCLWLTPLALLGIAWYERRRQNLQQPRSAKQVAAKTLQALRQPKLNIDTIYQLFNRYLQVRLQCQSAVLTNEEIKQGLQNIGAAALSDKILQIMQSLEAARLGVQTNLNLPNTQQRLVQLITELEDVAK